MKKLAFITLFGLCNLTAFAQVGNTSQQTTDPTDPTQQTTYPDQTNTDPTQPQTTNPTEQPVNPIKNETTETERRTTNPNQQPLNEGSENSIIKENEMQAADPDQQQMQENPNEQMKDENEMQAADPDQQPIDDAESMEGDGSGVAIDGYSKIAKRKLSKEMRKSFKENNPDVKIEQVYSNERGQYKFDISTKDGSTKTIYIDESGSPME